MKHYAENLGTNVAAMIKVRQVIVLLNFLKQGLLVFTNSFTNECCCFFLVQSALLI